MDRDQSIQRICASTTAWDLVVIGGGATGVAVALDAASRGLEVLLLERSDFGKGTSSRSTKLIHGGVRYLRQGNFSLVRDALRERALLRNNAPHLVHDMPFMIPCRNWWQILFYRTGLAIYDLLSSGDGFGRSRIVSSNKAIEMMPQLDPGNLSGGVVYHDGQFDDTRLLINMVRTAEDCGACLVNYAEVIAIRKGSDGKIVGVTALDRESNQELVIDAKAVVNAGGPFCDEVRAMDKEGGKLVAASQGVHLVLPRKLFSGETALIVPKTSDGRVLFFVPWHDHVLVGTTDTPIPIAEIEPTAQKQEIEFLLNTASEYLSRPPTQEDVLSVFVGIRPLVKADNSKHTASLSRDHVIDHSDAGLITITGGKWTTVRKMAEDCVDHVIESAKFAPRQSQTKTTKLHGFKQETSVANPRAFYGSDLDEIEKIESERPVLAELLHEGFPIRNSEVLWAVRNEMARTVEDVLARRTRALFLNTKLAAQVAPKVASLMADELGRSPQWCETQVDEFLITLKHFELPATVRTRI